MRVAFAEVKLPESVVRIDDYAFYGSESIKNVTLPQTLTYIGKAAFEGTGITKVVLPERLTDIAEKMFLECRKLESIYIPKAVQTIGKEAFKDCSFTGCLLWRK